MDVNFSAPLSVLADDISIRQRLIQHNILPTQEQAYKVFWGLGDNWWKQVIDGRFHIFGAEVFDKGLNKPIKEPGYLDSIKKACQYASEHLNEPISLKLYRSIHHIACQHFKNETNNMFMYMGQDQIDSFRGTEESAEVGYKDRYQDWLAAFHIAEARSEPLEAALQQLGIFDDPDTQEVIQNMININHWPKWLAAVHIASDRCVASLEAVLKQLGILKAVQKMFDIEDLWPHWFDVAIMESNHMKQKYHLDQNAIVLTTEGDEFRVYYNCIDEKVLSETTRAMLSNYLQAMRELGLKTIQALESPDKEVQKIKLQYQQEAVKNINKLYSELDLLHPWIDGQGRTDIVTLQFLLTQEGLTPAILEDPYYSSFHTFDDSTNYLHKGIRKWKSLQTGKFLFDFV